MEKVPLAPTAPWGHVRSTISDGVMRLAIQHIYARLAGRFIAFQRIVHQGMAERENA